MSVAEQRRISKIALENYNARKMASSKSPPTSSANGSSPVGRWWTYDLTEFSCDPEFKGRREILASEDSTTLIPHRFDYIDVGHRMRQEYMLPNELHPEPWQLQMFALLRQNKSLVVIAPTSSGKTMSAEYAMRISAQSPGHGVGVFVLPTNALVRQVYATLSTDPFIPRNSVAMFTSERRDNYDGNRYKILVTNPQCLHILIFSMNSSGRFSTTPFFQRINCVVIDEVHCIGATAQEISGSSDGSGVVIERLLCMLQCPIVCLSATLANARQFLSWLQGLRCGGHGNGADDIEIIEHHERSTALHYYSIGFDYTSHKPQLIDPQLTHQIGQNNLMLLCETEGTSCVISGQWGIPLPEPAGSANEMTFGHFRDTITKCVLSVKVSLNVDKEGSGAEDFSFTLNVRVLPHQCSPTGLMGTPHVTYNDDDASSVRGSPIPVNFSSSHLNLAFRFLVDPNQNQVVFEVGSINSPDLHSFFPSSYLFNLSSIELYFSTTLKHYRLSSLSACVQQSRRPLTLSTSLDPNAIPIARPIDLNPLSFVPRITYENPKVLLEFLTSSPSLQPHHIVETFDSLYTSLSSLPPLSIDLPSLEVPSQLIDVYETLARDTFDSNDLETFAFYRDRYATTLQQLHDIIFHQDSLVHRLLLNHMMSQIFFRSNLDWYGKLYFTSEPIQVQLEASRNWERDLGCLSTLTANNLIVSCLCHATSTLAFPPVVITQKAVVMSL